MDDLADRLSDPLAVCTETEPGGGQVAADRPHPPTMPLGSGEHRAEHGVSRASACDWEAARTNTTTSRSVRSSSRASTAMPTNPVAPVSKIASPVHGPIMPRAFDADVPTRITVPNTVPAAAAPAYGHRDRDHDTHLDRRTNSNRAPPPSTTLALMPRNGDRTPASGARF